MTQSPIDVLDSVVEGRSLGCLDLNKNELAEFSPAQLGALIAALSLRYKAGAESLLKELLKESPSLRAYVKIVMGGEWGGVLSNDSVEFYDIIKSAFLSDRYNSRSLNKFINAIVRGDVKDELVAFWLMTSRIKGISQENTRALLDAMIQSGKVYDYRTSPRLAKKHLVRRYPTGALSEKIALILPSIIASFRDEYAVASPFLVAKSLGFTGGTWDKLSAIPDFYFPQPGDESIDAIESCGVAMSVTSGDLVPADRILYKMRSATNTVVCDGLIISSIASKQIALPAHRLLMDVRFGPGAFVESKGDARDLAYRLCEIINQYGVPAFYCLTDAHEPNGSSLGNALEVAEAIAVMGGGQCNWDTRLVEHQLQLAIDFFSKMMAAEFPGRRPSQWAQLALAKVRNGQVIKAFKDILCAHGVSTEIANHLLEHPLEALGLSNSSVQIISRESGIIDRLDQKKLGYISNFLFGSGATEYGGIMNKTVGLTLDVRLGDPVCRGDTLCRVVGTTDIDQETYSLLQSSFILRDF